MSFLMNLKTVPLIIALIALLSPLSQGHAQTPATPAAQATSSASPESSPSATPTQPPTPESGIAFTVSPISVLIDLEPGTTQDYPLMIRNNGAQAEAIKISLKKLVGQPDNSFSFEDFTPEDPLPTWVTLTPSEFIIPPDSWFDVKLTFSPPQEAKLGYYFAIVFNRQKDLDAPPGSTQLVGAPAIIALADVASEDSFPQLTITDFSVSKKWYDFLPVEFNLTLTNTGNIHLQPFGNIFVDQGSNNDIATLEFNPGANHILPGMSRSFKVSWTDGFPVYVTDQDNPQQRTLQWDWKDTEKFRLGKFTVDAMAAYDDGTKDVLLESQLSFWVIPWQILTIIGIVALVLAFNFFFFLHIITRRMHK